MRLKIIPVVFISLFVCAFQISYAKSLTIGVPPLIPPLVMKTNLEGQYTGFDIDLMDEICRRIQAQCHYKPLSFTNVLSQVTSGEIDLGIGDITIIPIREKNYLFSLPYLPSSAQYVTQTSENISTIDEIRGKTIGARHAYVFEDVVTKQFGNQVTLKNYNNLSDLLNALGSDQVDTIIMEAPSARSIAANLTNLRLLGNAIPHGGGYGIVAAKDKEHLIQEINQALLDIESDGTYKTLYNTYFSPMDTN